MKNFNVKISALFSIFIISLLFISCDNDDDRAPDLSGNPEAREDVYNQILSDEQLFTEFTNRMSQDTRAMESLGNNRQWNDRMYGGDQMHRMMRDNPQRRDSLMHGMMANMERDTTMRPSPQMRQQMLQHVQVMMQRDTTFAWELREMISRQPATGGARAGSVQ